jgi:hypothetical protein
VWSQGSPTSNHPASIKQRRKRREERKKKKEEGEETMAKDDNFPFRYDSKSNTVFNTTGNKDVPVVRTKNQTKSWINTFFDLTAR